MSQVDEISGKNAFGDFPLPDQSFLGILKTDKYLYKTE